MPAPARKPDAFSPSPALTAKAQIVARELFGFVTENASGVYGVMVKTQRGNVEKMIEAMSEDSAVMIASHICDVADFFREQPKPQGRRRTA